jgi:hypothetical protein
MGYAIIWSNFLSASIRKEQRAFDVIIGGTNMNLCSQFIYLQGYSVRSHHMGVTLAFINTTCYQLRSYSVLMMRTISCLVNRAAQLIKPSKGHHSGHWPKMPLPVDVIGLQTWVMQMWAHGPT